MGEGDGVVVELRIHGVSGTPPDAMLQYPPELIEEVAGDAAAGFYRRRPLDDDQADSTIQADGASQVGTGRTVWRRVLEAYSWGGLTSGPASRALWILFLPFILINLAHWMLPPGRSDSWVAARAGHWSVRLLRLLGLSLTLLVMLLSSFVAVGLVGWQCAGQKQLCAAKLGPLRFLGDWSDGPRLAVTAAPVALMVLVLLWLGRRNPPAGQDKSAHLPDSAVLSNAVPLADENFWIADPSTRRLRYCHVSAWASGLAAVMLYGVSQHGNHLRTQTLPNVALVVNVGILVLAVLATLSTLATGRGGPPANFLNWPLRILAWLSVASLAVSLVVVACTPIQHQPPSEFPGLRVETYTLLYVQAGLLGALFVSTAVSLLSRASRKERGPQREEAPFHGKGWHPTLFGFTSFVLATIAWLFAGGFASGLTLWISKFLADPVPSEKAATCEIALTNAVTTGAPTVPAVCAGLRHSKVPALPADFIDRVDAVKSDAPLIVPPPLFSSAVVFTGLLVLTLIVAAVIWWPVLPRTRRALLPAVLNDYGLTAAKASVEEKQRAKEVASERSVAKVTDWLPPLLACFTVIAVLGYLAILFTVRHVGYDSPRGFLPAITGDCINLMAASAAAIVIIAIWAFRSRTARRLVGIMWDIGTFWPRANHPLTPPCYGERAVPDVRNRLQALTQVPSQRVILAAHSQGTVIAAATLLQFLNDADTSERLAADASERLATVTFGSPLRRLYARNFPAYFSAPAFQQVNGVVKDQWINMWCLTDPIGAWIRNNDNRDIVSAQTDIDYRITDVKRLTPGDPSSQPPPICGHSGYLLRPEYQDVITLLESKLTAGGVRVWAKTPPPTATD
jgi:hypothetical protein